MNFKEFVAIKQAQAIVEHLETLGEAEAVELLEQLDDATVELIEQILNEVTAGTVKRVKRDVEAGKQSPEELKKVIGSYQTRKRVTPPSPVQHPYRDFERGQGDWRASKRGQINIRLANLARQRGETGFEALPGYASRESSYVRRASRFDPNAPYAK